MSTEPATNPSAATPGPDHRAAVAPTGPTAPSKAFWRTVLQVGIPAFVGLVGIAPEVLQTVVDGFGQQLPQGFVLWLTGAAVTLTAASATLARIMASEKVLAWTRAYAPFFAPQKQVQQ
jgi:hypothetical protein